jgi:high-affinity iron transporter
MTGGFLITFREGLEAFLVIGIILSCLSRAGLTSYYKWIFGGAFLGVAGAFALAVVMQIFLSGFGGSEWEIYIKIGIMGFAVAVLSYMVVWMSSNARHIKGHVERKLDEAVSAGSVFALVFMAFLAVLREGFETVLFLGALYGDEMGAGVLNGGILGLVAAFAVTWGVFRGLKSLPVNTFFKITGALIVLIAAGLLTNMIGVLQDIKLIPMLTAEIYDISWLLSEDSEVGIFFKALFGYTSSPSVLQAVAYIGYVVATFFLLKGSGGRDDIANA